VTINIRKFIRSRDNQHPGIPTDHVTMSTPPSSPRDSRQKLPTDHLPHTSMTLPNGEHVNNCTSPPSDLPYLGHTDVKPATSARGINTNENAVFDHVTPTSSHPAPPDGGWGWMITLSSFMIMLVVDGVFYSYGVFFPHFRAYFDESTKTTSLIGSVQTGAYFIIGKHIFACQVFMDRTLSINPSLHGRAKL
jgi:hypothetical protein